MDKVATETRSRIMRAVRSRDNRSTERRLRASMVGAGIAGWTLGAKHLPGRPDFAFLEAQVALFVDGCFWHGCPSCYRRPASSQEYWDSKVRKNAERDQRNIRALQQVGWIVLRVWEHELSDLATVRANIISAVNGERDA